VTARSTREGRPALFLVAGLLCAVLSATMAACGDRGEDSSAEGDSGPVSGRVSDRADTAALPLYTAPPALWVDAAGDTLRLEASPERIVALVPSVTRVIEELGEAARLVGRTRYDTATAFADLPSVGAGMGPDYEALVALGADLVVYFVGASDPETPAQLERLGLRRFGVRPDDLDDVVELYGIFGAMLGRSDRGRRLAASLRATLDSVRVATAAVGGAPLGVTYLLDGDPPWAAGRATYIGQLVELAGGSLLPADLPPLYAQISPEGLIRADIDVILLSGDSNIDPRLVEGRRLERIPDWVEVPGPEVRAAAWVIAEALHPGLDRSPPGGTP
jgi:iron complex transport system substrate-binding protein